MPIRYMKRAMGESYEYDDADNWAESEEGIEKYFVVILSLLAIVLVLAKFLHDSPKLASILPEAGMIIIVGGIAGFIIDSTATYTVQDDDINQFVADGLLSFSPKVFFHVLLPPIIFNSGKRILYIMYFFFALKPQSASSSLHSSFVYETNQI